ncbi:MAG TPA: cell wall metabolism sensor histidine kinase WalK [Bacillales bacterium]|nr:cell wall metabolism sensor histidine kinase WalK [Bacillales bacterium]
MQKVGFFRSIHFKIALVYVLLLLLAMQVIGVYFISTLGKELRENFKTSIENQASTLSPTVAELIKDASLSNNRELQDSLSNILSNTNKNLDQVVQVISADNQVVLGTSNTYNRDHIVGRRTSETQLVQQALLLGDPQHMEVRTASNKRMYVYASPVQLYPNNNSGEILGVILIKAPMEDLYKQISDIIHIFEVGIVLSLVTTAAIGVFLSRTITQPVSAMRKHALQIAHGDFTQKVKVYGYDEIGQLATAFNQMTTRLKNANETTEAERKKLRSVLSYMTDGVIATDRNGNIVLMNNRAEEMLNVYRQNVFGMPILSLLKLEDTISWEGLDENITSRLIDLSDEEQKYILRANFSMIQKEEGPFNGVIVVLHDVTEQEQIEQDRREFVSNVSHELRTPLTTMKSYLEALSEGAVEDPEIAPKFIATAQNETDRMIRLVNDLLKLSRMDAKDPKLELNRVDFVEFFHQIIDRFEMTKKENIQFVRKLPNRKVYATIDVDKMTQVLDNIISNALKYSPNGGTVTFQLRRLQHHLHITISDEGVGIPKSKTTKIFERFYRVDKARSRQLGGTGLGLAIAREMIHAHGGEVWAESEWNVGTSFHLTLPVKEKKGGAVYELGRV